VNIPVNFAHSQLRIIIYAAPGVTYLYIVFHFSSGSTIGLINTCFLLQYLVKQHKYLVGFSHRYVAKNDKSIIFKYNATTVLIYKQPVGAKLNLQWIGNYQRPNRCTIHLVSHCGWTGHFSDREIVNTQAGYMHCPLFTMQYQVQPVTKGMQCCQHYNTRELESSTANPMLQSKLSLLFNHDFVLKSTYCSNVGPKLIVTSSIEAALNMGLGSMRTFANIEVTQMTEQHPPTNGTNTLQASTSPHSYFLDRKADVMLAFAKNTICTHDQYSIIVL
jgi:hypothetical protein